ncbi:hypothetical protein M501DRAFT_995323 [Patellaria atrata CBS 101060]|uniref:C2H2-type domain-containing protein n=1 Tax=Patellaria atrata CBS 101060 TaxID=1346257 RepID=A0A9P4VRC7_9PEZI|nr:hypothetical protein M501DRAFT_995323 [Patellaria atrata CBS 101060]
MATLAITSSSVPEPQSSHSTHPFTCNTCQVAFRSSDLQKAHMQSDWHRYNLKRRVASLPPLSSEIFTEKVLANQADAAAIAARASYQKVCEACQKPYYSENAYNNHLRSQKHKVNLLKQQRASAVGKEDDNVSVMSSTFSLGEPIAPPKETTDPVAEEEFSNIVEGIKDTSLEDRESPIPRRPTRPHHSSAEEQKEHPLSPTVSGESELVKPKSPILTCLFCNFASPTFPLNVLHMTRYHSMFIPEEDYLTDETGLIGFLHSKIMDDHTCLYCGKHSTTSAGIQTHMLDRGHCMIAFNSEEEMIEIGQFYDFSSTYSDEEDSDTNSDATADDKTNGGVKLGTKRTANNDDAMDEDDDGWETDSTLSSVPTDEITSVPIQDRSHRYKQLGKHRHHSHADPRPHREADGFHSHAHNTPHAVYHDEYELHLPSGRTAGHRSLKVYYRQNLRSYPSQSEREQRRITPGSGEDSDVEMADSSTRNPNGERGRRDQRQLATRANGGMGMVGVTDAKKREVLKAERRERNKERRHVEKGRWRNEKQGNSQKHYRDPLLQ